MRIIDTALEEVKIIEPEVYSDERGYFYESFSMKKFYALIGREINFVQDNHSYSHNGTLRGIHFQLPPFSQGKLVRAIQGEVYDVAVDLRKSSDTFMKWVGVALSEKNKRQLWIPEGFGHGFLVNSSSAHFLYKTTNYYNKESESSVLWNDPTLSIDWGINLPKLSNKDKMAPQIEHSRLFE